MRVGVFNEHWATLGGGEQFAGGIAQALSAHHDVDVLASAPLDLALLETRLGLDLSRTRERLVSVRDHEFVGQTAEYDLLVNCSFMSRLPNGARNGLYVVHFPNRPRGAWARVQAGARDAVAGVTGTGSMVVHNVAGVHPLEADGRSRWTAGKAEIELFVPTGRTAVLEFVMSSQHWPAGSRPRVAVTLDSAPIFTGEVDPSQPVTVSTPVIGRGKYDALVLMIDSDWYSPREELGTADRRELGILIQDLSLRKHRLPIREQWRRARGGDDRSLGFLASYAAVASNSAYTQRWVREWWGRASDVLYPPVRLRQAGDKSPAILGVGRFFASHGGHSKKQLELVQAFRALLRRGISGWTLHLAGGCAEEGRGYLDEVRRASAGLPVRFHVNATGAELRQLFAEASIFWHATGLGEHAERHPERLEHFGISVVEAMSAGAVPLVFGRGGPSEIVGDARNGFHFSSRRELVGRSAALIRDPVLLRAISDAARERALDFGFDEFSRRIEDLARRVASGESSSADTALA